MDQKPSVPESTPVYPVSTIPMSAAPPPYTVGVGAAPIAVEMQPVMVQPVVQPVAQTVYVTGQQQPGIQTVHTTTVVVSCKHVEYDHPYLEYCPRCQTSVTTRTVYSTGGCWWAILIIGLLTLCWPIWCWLCCTSSKDVKHFCPNCATMLAVKKRGC